MEGTHSSFRLNCINVLETSCTGFRRNYVFESDFILSRVGSRDREPMLVPHCRWCHLVRYQNYDSLC